MNDDEKQMVRYPAPNETRMRANITFGLRVHLTFVNMAQDRKPAMLVKERTKAMFSLGR